MNIMLIAVKNIIPLKCIYCTKSAFAKMDGKVYELLRSDKGTSDLIRTIK